MVRETQIRWRDFIKAIEKCANQRFEKCDIIPRRGSKRRIELFRKETDEKPYTFWVVHEDRYVYSKDLKKACNHLEVSKKEFSEIINSL